VQGHIFLLNRLHWKEWLQIPNLMSSISALIEKLHRGLFAIRRQLKEYDDLDLQLSNAGWIVVERCRGALESIKNGISLLDEIDNAGFADEQSNSIQKELSHWESTLSTQIPALFFTVDRQRFDNESDRKTVISVNNMLKPVLQETTPIIRKINKWKDALEELDPITTDLSRKNVLLNNLLDRLRDDATLAIEYDENAEKLEKMNDAVRQELSSSRAISNIISDIRRIKSLANQQAILLKYITELDENHEYILNFSRRVFIADLVSWASNATRVLESTKRYNTANWSEGIDVEQLYENIKTLLAQFEHVQRKFEVKKILESEVMSLYDLITQASTSYDATNIAYNNFLRQLQVVTTTERESKEIISNIQAIMNQVRAIVESNPLIKQKSAKTLEKFFLELNKIEKDLNDPEKGSVKKKNTQLITLITRIETALKQWVDILEKDNLDLVSSLTHTVDLLQSMVAISDPIYVEIISLLQRTDRQFSDTYSHPNPAPLVSITNELKTKSDYWQKLVASTRTLDEMFGPIQKEFNKMEKNRKNLSDLMGRADHVIPEKLSWPPTTKRLSIEREKFNKLEENYQSFKVMRHKAIQMVSAISDLADQYRELHAVISKIVEIAGEEQKRFMDLERRFHQSKSLWNLRISEYKSNRVLVGAVEEMLEASERDYGELQKRYLNGALNYQQAFQMFRVLCRKLDQSSVSAGANQIIDITGQIHHQL
jgi:hypothetical protein